MKDLPQAGGKEEDGRERRHTGGAAGAAVGPSPSPKPNPPSGGENKHKLGRQNSHHKNEKMGREANTQDTSTTNGK